MAKPTLLPDPGCLRLKLLDASDTAITVVVRTISPQVECPLCHQGSPRIHSHYVRAVADLPWMGCAVTLSLHVRRFFCSNQQCERQIFAERLPTVVAPYARRTTRLTEVFTLIGFALGGEEGSRLVAGMGLVSSPDTLLRLLRATPDKPLATPRILGVDDFAFRRRRTYGTILIDLEKRVPVDLLPDREADTLAKWLMAHPGVEYISRDRGGDYAKGAKEGAPNAKQVADRWHLLKNLSETMQSYFLSKPSQLQAASKEAAPTTSEETAPTVPWHTGMTKRQEEKSQKYHQERVDRYHQIQDLRAKQVDVRTIAQKLGMSRQGVYIYLQMKQPPERTRIHRSGRSSLESHKEYLIRRWNEGCRNAQLLYREIKAAGYTGGRSAVGRFIAPWRALKGEAHKFKSVEPKPELLIHPDEGKKKRPPTALQAAHWITFREDQRLDWQKAYLARLCQADQEIAHTYELIQDFTTMLRERRGERLDSWLKLVKEQAAAELQSFAQGLERDYEAVKAGLTLVWSQGPVEGHVHRLKLLKRQSYGRAGFQMLRKRVLRCG